MPLAKSGCGESHLLLLLAVSVSLFLGLTPFSGTKQSPHFHVAKPTTNHNLHPSHYQHKHNKEMTSLQVKGEQIIKVEAGQV